MGFRRCLVHERLHDRVLKIALDLVIQILNHHQRDQFFGGIDPDLRAVGAKPPAEPEKNVLLEYRSGSVFFWNPCGVRSYSITTRGLRSSDG